MPRLSAVGISGLQVGEDVNKVCQRIANGYTRQIPRSHMTIRAVEI